MYNTVVLVCSPQIANLERYTQFYTKAATAWGAKPSREYSREYSRVVLLTEQQFWPGLRFEEAGVASGQAKAGHRSRREVRVVS